MSSTVLEEEPVFTGKEGYFERPPASTRVIQRQWKVPSGRKDDTSLYEYMTFGHLRKMYFAFADGRTIPPPPRPWEPRKDKRTKLEKLQALVDRGATEGERAAARAAIERLMAA